VSVILTLTSTVTGGGGLTSTTTSGITTTDVLISAAIVGVGLLVSLVVTELLSAFQDWSKGAAAAVRWINLTLVIVFCVFVALITAPLL
jgi:hypothetical protein